MDYVGNIFRPPSEARSLLIQVAVGCSYNRCDFCGMYLDKQFKVKPLEIVIKDLEEYQGYDVRRVFLCDGDALILSQERLKKILQMVSAAFPNLERVGVYGDAHSILKKSINELKELKDLGLKIIYHGAESGSAEVLTRINKGSTRKETIESGHRVKEAGIAYSVMVLLGLGGKELSDLHARETASYLSEVNPDFVGALTLTLVPGTPLWQKSMAGTFQPLDKFDFLRELRTIISEVKLDGTYFTSMHASNYLSVKLNFPKDKEKGVQILDKILLSQNESALRPEFLRGL